MATFAKWLDTFLSEKGIDLDEGLEVPGPSGTNYMTIETVVTAMKQRATEREQEKIKAMMVRLDFANADCRHFIAHMAKALAI